MKRRPTDRGWSAKLTRSIVLKDCTTLATLADARAFILREPAQIQITSMMADNRRNRRKRRSIRC